MAEDNLGTSDLLEFAIYLPALSLDLVYFFLLNNCNSLASFSFRNSIFKVPVFSSHPCLRVSICSMVLFPIFVFFVPFFFSIDACSRRHSSEKRVCSSMSELCSTKSTNFVHATSLPGNDSSASPQMSRGRGASSACSDGSDDEASSNSDRTSSFFSMESINSVFDTERRLGSKLRVSCS